MPIMDTPFILSLKKQYGSDWERIFYSMKSKYPDNPAILQAEGKYKKHKIHKLI
jgi:hypothetical protein